MFVHLVSGLIHVILEKHSCSVLKHVFRYIQTTRYSLNFRKEVDKSPLKQKNVSPSKLDDSPIKGPSRKRARVLESDEEEENSHTSPSSSESKSCAQRLEEVSEQKKASKVCFQK